MPTRTTTPIAWIVAAALSWPGPPAAAQTGGGAAPWAVCAERAVAAERAHRLPRGLLRAIAKVESGRYRKAEGEVVAWPWTVMAERRGRYLPSRAAAVAEVERLLARGVRNIDVGCLQINLFYHPDAFDSLEAAFDPAANAEAAARLLVELRRTWGSWTRAVGNYHSNTPTLSGPYRVKVYRTLFRDRRRAIAADREARRAG